MRCCACYRKLSVGVILRGEGVCSVCNQKQMTAKKYTFSLVSLIVIIFLIFGISLISIAASLILGGSYLIISKTEPMDGD